MNQFFSDAWSVLLELSPWLLLGAAIAGLMHVLLPAQFVQRHLRGGPGVAKAVLLGVPLPLCSCGVIPTGLGLRRDGASAGATSGFMIATPQTGVDSVLVSAGFLGWPFALTKVVAALVTGMAGGLLTDSALDEPAESGPRASGALARKNTARDGIEHARQLLRSIWKWIAFGVLASAALTSFVEPGAFTSVTARGTMIGFAAVLVVSLPLYVCATASVPIAVGLIAAGMPTGAALVFLMAGPATNIATLGAVRASLGLKATGIYLVTIISGSTIFGLVYEAVFGSFDVDMLHAHSHSSWWRVLSAFVLLAILGSFMVESAQKQIADRQANLRANRQASLGADTAAGVGSAAAFERVELGVDGMSCGACVNKLDKALRSIDGVASVDVSLDTASVVVQGSAPASELRQQVVAAGFTPQD